MIKRYVFHWREAVQLFHATRTYDAKWLRWVCRYHLYVSDNDYALRSLFCRPRSLRAFRGQVESSLRECEEVYRMGLYDSRQHYDGCRLYLRTLRSFCKHYPITWMIVFRVW